MPQDPVGASVAFWDYVRLTLVQTVHWCARFPTGGERSAQHFAQKQKPCPGTRLWVKGIVSVQDSAVELNRTSPASSSTKAPGSYYQFDSTVSARIADKSCCNDFDVLLRHAHRGQVDDFLLPAFSPPSLACAV